MSRPDLVVVGGGVAGLAAAWFAAEAGLDVTVLEAAPQVGGKLQLAEVGGVSVDVGAEAMLAARPEGVALAGQVGLDTVAPVTTAARVRAGGRFFPLPRRTLLGVPGDIEALRESGALSDAALRVVEAEPSLPPLPPLTRDVSVGSLVRSRLGDEVADRLVDPLLGGVYAGSADGLSLRATVPRLAELLAGGGSLVELVASVTGTGAPAAAPRPPFTSVRGGMGRLPQQLAASGRFTVRTGVTVRRIDRTGRGFALECGAVPVSETLDTDAVIVAVPAPKAARLLGGVAPDAARELGAIEYASMAVVSFAYDDPSGDLAPQGSGLLVAAGERLATKAITLTSRKWPIETGGRTVLRASVGRFGEPHALRLDDGQLGEIVRRDVAALTGIESAPLDTVVTRWGGGLPQYPPGHLDRVARTRAALAPVPGLAACGAAFDGVGVPACIASARVAVDQVLAGPDPRG
ncbi:protoporphyrinogen oxidase [Jatrophihabitans fulvus]